MIIGKIFSKCTANLKGIKLIEIRSTFAYIHKSKNLYLETIATSSFELFIILNYLVSECY